MKSPAQEQKARSKEQGARSKEQGARSNKRSYVGATSGRATSGTFKLKVERSHPPSRIVRGGNLPAAAIVAWAGRDVAGVDPATGHSLVTAGHRGRRPRVTSGSASGRWAR